MTERPKTPDAPGPERAAGASSDPAAGLTPEQLSELLMRRRATVCSEEPGARRGAIPRRHRGAGSEPVPASYAQQRIWLLDRLQPASAAYNMPFSYRLRGPLDQAALEGALTDLAERHESLRTVFTEADGQPLQRVLESPREGFVFEVRDLTDVPQRRRRAEAERLRDEVAAAPFDLSAGPLFRLLLLRLGEQEHHLVLNVHHIVFDGWSVSVLWRELGALYAARRSGRPSELPPTESVTQYGDFARWQRERLVGEELERQLGYWRRRLAGELPMLDLPVDRPRPSQPRNRGAVVRATLPPGLRDGLRRFARSRDASLFMVLLAGYKVLLARLAGQGDLLVGTPVAGRTLAELEGVIGFFVNTLVIRTDLADDPSFGALVDRVRDAVLGATEHQEVPFEKLLEELQPERHLSRAPLFQVLFNMVDLPEEGAGLDGLGVSALPFESYASKFDFTLYAESAEEGIHLQLVYDADLFEHTRMEELLRQYEHLLARVVAEPERPVGGHSLVTEHAAAVLPDPRAPLSEEWLGPVHHALTRGAREVGDRVAIADRVGTLSYAEVERRANRIAHRLLGQGFAQGDRVALLAQRDASLPVALFGALGAGGAVSVLDPAYPEARLAQLLERLAPRAVIVGAGCPDPELPGGVAVLHVPPRGSVEERRFLDDELETPPGREVVDLGPNDPALVTFTSGSTGEPKGVVGRHGSLSHFLPQMAERFGLGADDRFSMLSALSHDPLQRDVFTPIWLGACLVVPDPERLGEPGWSAAWAARERVSVAGLTPAMVQLLSRPPRTEGDEPAPFLLDALRRVFVVGDKLTRADVSGLVEIAPEVRCVNLYGATETQRAVSFHEVDLSRVGNEVLPLGHGLEGVQLLVLRGDGSLAGVGETGEIHVRSHHLAAGYLNDSALTAERFVASPFAADADTANGSENDRLYRTGDLGRYRADGEVEVVGRRDGQVKIRGFRIETGEVASVLRRHGEVGECSVVARDDLPGGRGLAAYVVPAGRSTPSPRRLREFLVERLPDYMVPTAFVSLERLPLTATGKVDRRALPAPSLESLAGGAAGAGWGSASGGALAPPQGPVEELLAAQWQELLGLPEARRGDDFFALGGHSLLATRLLARVRSVLGVEVPLAALFEASTVAGLARRIEALESGPGPGRGRVLPPVERLPEERRRGPIPLSWAQERVWFLDRLEDGTSAAYNVTVGVRLTGTLRADALAGALDRVVERHESLRCLFGVDDLGRPYQSIHPPAPVPLPVADLSGLDEERRRDELAARSAGLSTRPFDLAAGPLLRALLVRTGQDPEDHVLVLSLHHIATDGWSFGVLFRELSVAYAELVGEARPEGGHGLPPLAVQYPDFAAWQRGWLQGEVLEEQLGFWKGLLSGAPTVLSLPTDRPRPPQQTFQGARVSTELSPALVERLLGLCRRVGATPFMVLLSVYGTTLARIAGVDDLVAGVPVANRRHRELEDLIGFFANTLALRVDLRPNDDGSPASFLDVVGRVRAASLGGFGHQDLPFERLVDALEVERDLSRSPLTQVAFAFQNAPGADLELPGLTVREEPLGGAKSQLDLNLQMRDVEGDAIEAVLEYATALFDRTTAERFLERLRLVLEGALGDPSRAVLDLPVLTEEERGTVLGAWNATARPLDGPTSLHELIRTRADQVPGRTAVVGDDRTLTYRELADEAARLGRHLAALGAGPERPVGVLTERSAAMVVALLGVLESGAPYLPLDPAYPEERLRLMVDDAGVELVVTEERLADRLAVLAVAEKAGHPVRPVVVDGADRAEIAARPAEPLGRAVAPESLAYLIYTSGSTGRPKGVAVPHGAAVSFLASMAREPGLTQDDVVLSTTTISFDISVLEIFLPLATGASVVVVDRETAVDGLALAARMEGVTVLQATPTTWRLLLDSGWQGSPGLRVLSGGEPLDRELAERLHGVVREVWNVYGPTETTVWSTVDRVRVGEEGAVSIGRPIGNTRVYVVDRGLRPVPRGSVGELVIGGVGVTRGYRGRPGATAERFVPDPFGRAGGDHDDEKGGGRLYRTGDLARWRPDGRLECLGRTDQQVKVRGHRIEPGEIETLLVEHPAVLGAAVVARGRDPVRLAAYLVAEPGSGEPTVLDLRAHLAREMPDYMVPATFTFLAELPRTPNGKVDRNALPEPEAAGSGRAELGEEYEAPTTDAEQALATVWGEVLGLERAGLKDNFFALGGDSILGIQVVTRLGHRGWHLAVRDLFRHQTLGELAGAAVPTGGPRAGEAVPAVDEVDLFAASAAPQEPPAGGIDVSEAGLSAEELEELLLEID